MLKRDVLGAGGLIDSRGDEFAQSLVHDDEFLREVGLGLIMWKTIPLTGGQGVSLVGLREAWRYRYGAVFSSLTWAFHCSLEMCSKRCSRALLPEVDPDNIQWA